MKILMLGWELPPHHSGGMGVACYQMCEELSSNGVDIEFILPYTAEHGIDFMKVSPANHQTAEDFVMYGSVYDSDYFGLETRLSSSGAPLDLRHQHDLYASNVAKLVSSKEFDVIHAHDWLTFRAGLAAKQVSGKPLVLHVHATQYDQSAGGHGNPLAREIEEEAFALADRIFAVSQHTKNVIVQHYGVRADKIEVVHNSVEIDTDVDESMNAHRYLDLMRKSGYRVVSSIGRMTIQKGLTHLIETAEKVVAKNPKILFLIAGGGEQKEELIRMVAEKRISANVIIGGWVAGKERRDSFSIADIFILPSVSEPFGLTALEAVSYGTPVIVSKQSGVSEVLQNCFKADFWDTDMMSDMILSLCENDSLARTMWQNSYDEYLKQSWTKSAKIMKQKYAEVHGAAV
jgi:glycogen(starch) synthase